MPRKALFVGIDYYSGDPTRSLNGCVRDAAAMRDALRFHANFDVNYESKMILGMPPKIIPEDHRNDEKDVYFDARTAAVRQAIENLFKHDDAVLFYFSGHGQRTPQGPCMVTADATTVYQGILLQDLLKMANASKAREVVLIIDCCYSGSIAEPDAAWNVEDAVMRPGRTVFASSLPHQVSIERDKQGIFTKLMLIALSGAAADVRGWVTPAQTFAFIEQSLTPWDQRPMFKSNATHASPLRFCEPVVDDDDLRQLPKVFQFPFSEFTLDKSYEVTQQEAVADHLTIFNLFKRYQLARLLHPSNPLENSLYWTAMREQKVELTQLGQFYWQMARDGRVGGTPAFSNLRRKSVRNLAPETVAQLFHESYERLAPYFNYTTREATRKPWAEIPEQNKRLMIAVAIEVLGALFEPEKPNLPEQDAATPRERADNV